MAITLVHADATHEYVSGSTSLSITIGSGAASGDLIIIGYMTRSPVSPPAGFTKHAEVNLNSGGVSAYNGLLVKVSDGTEGGTSISVSQSSSGRMELAHCILRGTTGTVSKTTSLYAESAASAAMSGLSESSAFAAVSFAHNTWSSISDSNVNLNTAASDAEWTEFGGWPPSGGSSASRSQSAYAIYGSGGTTSLTWDCTWPDKDWGASLITVLEEGPAAPVSFYGTVPTQNLTENVAMSTLDLSTYFSGAETPFSYAVQTGSLPAGLSLNSSTGEITGTPTATGTFSIVVRATDQTPDTADTNSFDIVVAAAVTEIKGIQLSLKEANGTTAAASLTNLYYHAWDALNPGGAPDANGSAETTDASGVLEIDIESFSASVGGEVFLFVYSLDGTEDKDSVCFAGRVPVVDIS